MTMMQFIHSASKMTRPAFLLCITAVSISSYFIYLNQQQIVLVASSAAELPSCRILLGYEELQN